VMIHIVPMINLFKCGIIFTHVLVHLVDFISGILNPVAVLANIDLDASKEGFSAAAGVYCSCG
jgi:hypothetical protein